MGWDLVWVTVRVNLRERERERERERKRERDLPEASIAAEHDAVVVGDCGPQCRAWLPRAWPRPPCRCLEIQEVGRSDT